MICWLQRAAVMCMPKNVGSTYHHKEYPFWSELQRQAKKVHYCSCCYNGGAPGRLWTVAVSKHFLEIIKENSHQFGVNLCIQPGIANEVDNPSLSFLGWHVEFVRQHAVQETRGETGFNFRKNRGEIRFSAVMKKKRMPKDESGMCHQ